MNATPILSIIVATRNEALNIDRCLQSVLRQNYQKVEIIVIDFDSRDPTKQIALKYTDCVFDIQKEKDLRGIRNFRGAQLNFGASISRGDILFFPDADMTMGHGLLHQAVQMLDFFDALYVPEIVEGDHIFQRLRNFERSFYNQTSIDAVRFVKKSFYRKIGGFDETNIEFGFDDWDFNKRLIQAGGKISVCPYPLYHHEERIRLSEYLRKKRNYTKSYHAYVNKWGKHDPDIRRQFSLFYRMLGIFIEKGKWKQFCRSPHYAIGVLVLKFLVGILFIYLKVRSIRIIQDQTRKFRYNAP